MLELKRCRFSFENFQENETSPPNAVRRMQPYQLLSILYSPKAADMASTSTQPHSETTSTHNLQINNWCGHVNIRTQYGPCVYPYTVLLVWLCYCLYVYKSTITVSLCSVWYTSLPSLPQQFSYSEHVHRWVFDHVMDRKVSDVDVDALLAFLLHFFACGGLTLESVHASISVLFFPMTALDVLDGGLCTQADGGMTAVVSCRTESTTIK